MEHADDLTTRIRDAALAGDGALLARLERERQDLAAVAFAEQCARLRVDIEELETDRADATRERAALESMHELAAGAWRDATDRADQLRIESQQIGARLGGLDARIEIMTDDLKTKQAELTKLLSTRTGD
jgi:chromosome segregation ATPase